MPSEVYARTCAGCHGPDGRGRAVSHLGFEVPPVPDFTDCSFNSREPTADWHAIASEGGPARGFSTIMPAFGDALTDAEMLAAVAHVKTFCDRTKAWPVGELNLPKALYTGKAFLEDEAVLTTTIDAEGDGFVKTDLTYEKRWGARSMVELKVPWIAADLAEGDGTDWGTGAGDVVLAFKHAPLHSARSGSILAFAVEAILPVGDPDRGFGKGVTVFEPFLAYGQTLPANAFVQLQVGGEIPAEAEATNELFYRGVTGISLNFAGIDSRTWTPMVEFLGVQELEAGVAPEFAVVPQAQVTLNQRQHVRVAGGVYLPVNHADERDTQVRLYLLWDWFDGGFFQGW